MADQIATWSGCSERVLCFPESEVLPFERISADAETTRERLRALIALALQEAPPVIVASAGAIAQKTLGKDLFENASHTLRSGEVVDVDELLKTRESPVKVAVMGCEVNGPGEAKDADVGIAAGAGRAVIFRKGRKTRVVEEAHMMTALLEEVDAVTAELTPVGG